MVTLVNVVHVSSETVFVQFFMGGSIPEAAGVRGDFVCQNDGAIAELTKLQLEVYQIYVDLFKESLEDFIDLEGIGSNLIQLFTVHSCIASAW